LRKQVPGERGARSFGDGGAFQGKIGEEINRSRRGGGVTNQIAPGGLRIS